MTQAVTQEFQISITPVLGADTYWLRTEAVATGVPLAEAQVTWPLETWLAQAEALFQDPLHALLSGSAAPVSNLHGPDRDRLGADHPWTQLGQALYQGLFQGRIRDSWVAAQSVAQNRRQPLRLRLGFKDSRVQRLPWELLYGDDRPLATGLDVTLCRYYQGQTVADLAAMAPLAPASVPLRVLVVISAPDDQERLALRQEVQSLMDSLQTADPKHLGLAVTILEQPGRPELVQALEQGNFQVLHYAGHSDAGETGGDLFLVSPQTGLTDRLSGEDLAGLLVNNGIRLAVFNSCRGAYTAQDDAQAGWRDQNLVQALVNRGVPGVIAMADRIPDDVALTFTQLLYRNLHQGYPIDLCLSRVRQGLMSAYGSDQPFWMLPLLYLRPDFDGYLYTGHPDDLKGLDAMGQDDLTNVALMPPDYSTDPEISSLAAEILSRQASDAETERLVNRPDGSGLPLYDWLQEGDPAEAAATDAAVANLVQQLSQPRTANGDGRSASGDHPPLAADPTENLLPQPDARPRTSGSDALWPSHSPTVNGAAAQPLTNSRRWPSNLWVWGGLGLAGLGAVLWLSLTSLAIFNRPVAAPPALPEIDPPAASGDSPAQPGTNAALLSSAIGALALDRTPAARTLIEQLLDRNDLVSAASALATASDPQLQDPDIAYVRGRLAWQQISGDPALGTTAYDVMRAWSTATEARPDFLEAWVSLGFSHYALGDYGQAIQAWERAIAIDQGQRRDIDPAAGLRLANPFTVNAYAGLAMAFQKESAIGLLPEERSPLQQQAESYYLQILTLAPAMVNPNTLATNWLWSGPGLIADWQTTIAQLAIGHRDPQGEGLN
ncbi:CHAT domain-containing protein [Leptolyngbya sp. KIOST-1]|uniref:CHAT domain-containing protein n=1 Tax=Leptolyngbya sp. KIOST-1 TaxID=1229172 RepID=UPI00068A226C|nr:CHAT domain-containing protein [Leptolyngbya sp. KIOST-1]